MEPQQTPRPAIQKPPMGYSPQQPPPSTGQRFPSSINNGSVNGPRQPHPEDKTLTPNPNQQQSFRPPGPFGPPRTPSGVQQGSRNVFLQRPPGPRPGPPGSGPAGPRFPPPSPQNPGQFSHPNQGSAPSATGSSAGPGFYPGGPPRPPYPNQRPPESQFRPPLSRNSSLSSQEDQNQPKSPNPLQRNDSNNSLNDPKLSRDRPPRILIDKTMTDVAEEKIEIDKKTEEPSKTPINNSDNSKGSENKITIDAENLKNIKEKSTDENSETKSAAKVIEGAKMLGNNLSQNLADSDSVKGFDNGERRSLSSRTPSREESPKRVKSSSGAKDGNKTPEQEKKRAHFAEDAIETKERNKLDRKTWNNADRSPRNSASKDRGLRLSVKPADGTDVENDSGVDESTQRKEGPTTNGVSPIKRIPIKTRDDDKHSTAGSPVKSPCKNSKSLPRTPDSTSSNSLQEKKKVPMNKVQVGAAPSPNLKAVKSKIGSMENASYKPGGGKVKIENRKLDFSKAQPKIAAKNDKYTPSGGDKKITQVKLQWNAKPKVGSLENATYKPGGGDKKIETVKLDFKDKAKPKVGSKDNAKHVPGGGSVKSPTSQPKTPLESPKHIETQKIEIKAESKVGSLDNVKHKPGGGDKKIFNDKDYLKQTGGSNAESVSGSGSQSPIPSGTVNDGLPT